MDENNWRLERESLNKRFRSGDIVRATRKELEWYLVILANTRNHNGNSFDDPAAKSYTESLANVVRHFLQVRLGEELHEKSHRISVVALVVAIAAAGFAGFEAWNVYATRQQPTQQFAPAKLPEPLPPAKLPTPAMQSLPYIPLTNSKAVSQPTP